jgi:hypothetical protein
MGMIHNRIAKSRLGRSCRRGRESGERGSEGERGEGTLKIEFVHTFSSFGWDIEEK